MLKQAQPLPFSDSVRRLLARCILAKRALDSNLVEYMYAARITLHYENPVRIVGLNIGNGCAYKTR